jgi:hypothetical protein
VFIDRPRSGGDPGGWIVTADSLRSGQPILDLPNRAA